MTLLALIARNGGSILLGQLVEQSRVQYENRCFEILDRTLISETQSPFRHLDRALRCGDFDGELEKALGVIELCGLVRYEHRASKFVETTPFGEGFMWRSVLRAEALAVTRREARRASEARMSLAGEQDVGAALAALFWLLHNDGPEALVETLATVGKARHQIEWCELFAQSPDERAAPVLEAIAGAQPDAAVARAARKAAFKSRSVSAPGHAS
jgi:hypothetical protein